MVERRSVSSTSGSFTISAVLLRNSADVVFVESVTVDRNGECVLILDSDGWENFVSIGSSVARKRFLWEYDIEQEKEKGN